MELQSSFPGNKDILEWQQPCLSSLRCKSIQHVHWHLPYLQDIRMLDLSEPFGLPYLMRPRELSSLLGKMNVKVWPSQALLLTPQ
jgi:hypothetical protein